ncbi:histidine kinase [Rhizobium sp. Leaf384]|uniref:phosphate regulon sensor histidine kinase PhoR n=1 Tax=unclassified Rhizobium TaxID=2613769 RepID=UPI0007155EC6|nr:MULTISPECIES: phosphate regulon sensor histidine kinase PhoR [unclassified Rhizobium]KQS81077.1 histidine kinase [Rhizobium sp. Leaf384]KQS86985.1 histidine kinase [Rhizobium sp. Leaf383]
MQETTFWQTIASRIWAEKWLVGLTFAGCVALIATSGHPVLAGACWLTLVTALLRQPATPSLPPHVEPLPSTGETELSALESGFDALDMPVLIIGADERVLFQNQAAEKAFGVIPPHSDLSGRVRSPGILDMVRETIATGRVNQIEHSERLPSEAVYIVRVAPAALGAPRPRVDPAAIDTVYIVSYRDISQARRIDRMRSDFVANASHELRTPLASLRGFIETLQGPARNDVKAQERFLGIMLEQATRMSRLVDDLLSLSRLELKSHIAPEQDIALGPLLGHVCDTLGPLAQDLGVAIALDLPSVPVIVQGDRDELIEVFENLVENACKYGQEGKTVEVSLSGGGGDPVEVSVRDRGPGIPAEHVPRITERFYRVNVEASRSKKGTGLGLAIVKHILTRHRARLLVRSVLGEGTVFTVRF